MRRKLKKVTAYSLDPDIIEWVNERAYKKDRSSSYVVNAILKEKKRNEKV